jgi:hypothetical protein
MIRLFTSVFALCLMSSVAGAQNATPFNCRRPPPPPGGLLGLPACDSQPVINEIVRNSKPGFAISGVQVCEASASYDKNGEPEGEVCGVIAQSTEGKIGLFYAVKRTRTGALHVEVMMARGPLP